jgi:hypothetical protein
MSKQPHSRQSERARESELVEFLHSIDVRAPESLHSNVEAMIAERSARGGRGRARKRERERDGRARSRARRRAAIGPRLAAGGAILAAVIALAIVVATNGSSATLSVHDASALTLRAATAPAPAESAGNRAELAASVEGVTFPYWGTHFGWRATGRRSDRLDGRTVTTVFYENSRGRRVGYAIVGGTDRSQISGGVVSRRDGTPYRLLTVNGVAVIAWMREGHLCVISGHGVTGATLLRLASWDQRRPESS